MPDMGVGGALAARGIANRTRTTPAQALGVLPDACRLEEILAWRQALKGIDETNQMTRA